MVYKNISELPQDILTKARNLSLRKKIIMCPPTFFKVIDVKNVHMEGHIGSVNETLAQTQWTQCKRAIQNLEVPVIELIPTPNLEDMVFTANPAMVGLNTKKEKIALLSNMKHPSRQQEVKAHEAWLSRNGYQVKKLSTPAIFEGHGDAIWQWNKAILWGGYGHRTEESVYEEISNLFEVPVLALKLVSEHFYHLDTCFCPISANTVMIYEGAFEPEGLEMIRRMFKNIISVPEKDARNFACNALCIDKKVILHKGSIDTCKQLKNLGFETAEVDTSEFMKSGGSICCMKLEVF